MNEATQSPAAQGSLAKTPFAHLVLYLYQRRSSGTLIVHTGKAGRSVETKVLFHRGRAVAAHLLQPAAALDQALLPLCTADEGSFEFHESDLVGSGAAIVTGMFDPFAFVAESARREVRADVVDEILTKFSGIPLTLQPSMDLSRLSLTPSEAQFAEPLLREPASLEQLQQDSPLEPEAARRLLYVLLITKIVVPHASESGNSSIRARERSDVSQPIPAANERNSTPSRSIRSPAERSRTSGAAWRAIASRAAEMASNRPPPEGRPGSSTSRMPSQSLRTPVSGSDASHPLRSPPEAADGEPEVDPGDTRPLTPPPQRPARGGSRPLTPQPAVRGGSRPLTPSPPSTAGGASRPLTPSPQAAARAASTPSPQPAARAASRPMTPSPGQYSSARSSQPETRPIRPSPRPARAGQISRPASRPIINEDSRPISRPLADGTPANSPARRAPSRPLTPSPGTSPSTPGGRPVSRPLTPNPHAAGRNSPSPRMTPSGPLNGGSPRPSLPDVDTLDANGKFKRVELLCSRHAYEEALPIVRALHEDDRKNAKYLGMLSHVLLGRSTAEGQIGKDIVEAVNLALRIDPDQVHALYTKARCYKRMGKEREALHYFRRTVTVDPQHIEATREVRLLLLRMSERKKKG